MTPCILQISDYKPCAICGLAFKPHPRATRKETRQFCGSCRAILKKHKINPKS